MKMNKGLQYQGGECALWDLQQRQKRMTEDYL